MSEFTDRKIGAMSSMSKEEEQFVVRDDDESEKEIFESDAFNVEKQLLSEVGRVKKVSKPLNLGASVFIPVYNPSISILDVLSLVSEKNLDKEEKLSLLRSKGYPDWWAMRIATAAPNNMGIQYAKARTGRRQDRDFNESGKGAKAAPVLVEQSQVKSSGNLWRIYPRPNSPLVDKPRVYSHNQFVAWVYGLAWQLQYGITRKTQFITGNGACETLFKTSTIAASSREAQNLLVKANVFIEDYKDLSRKPPGVRLSEFVTDLPEKKKILDIAGILVHSIEELSAMELTFKRHKPLYKAAMAYFVGVEEIDEVKLQASIHEKIKKPVVYTSEVVSHQGGEVSDYDQWKIKMSVVRQELKYQGLFDFFPSLSPRVTVNHTIPPFPVTHVLPAFPAIPAFPTLTINHQLDLSGSAASIPSNAERVVIQITTLIAQLVISPSWKHAFLAVTQFVAGNDVASGVILSILKRSMSRIRFQGDGDEEGKIEDPKSWWQQPVSTFRKELFDPIWEAVVSCALVSIVSEFFSTVRQELCVPIPDLVKAIKASVIREGATTLAKSLIAGVLECIERIKRCVAERSLLPLWGTKWDPEKWIAIAENAVLRYADLVIAPNGVANLALLATLRQKGEIPMHWTQPVTLPQYLTWIEEHADQGSQLIAYFKSSPPMVSRLVAVRNKLVHHVETCNIILNGGNIRMAPAFVIFYGETGVGKSNLQQSFPKAVARMNSYDESSAGVYDWMMNANFQHLSHQHWCVRIDDPGHGVAPPAAGVKNEIEEVMALVNNSPYPVEQADVSLKGKVFAYPSLVVVSTNYFSMRVNQLTRYSPAFWRRVTFHVEVAVKPEYRIEGGTCLDPTKVTDIGSHDLHILKVRVFDPTIKDPKLACLKEPVEMSYPQFLYLFHRTFSEHQKHQRQLVCRAMRSGPWCPDCGLDSSGDCGHSANAMVDEDPPAYRILTEFEKQVIYPRETEEMELQGFLPSLFSLAVGAGALTRPAGFIPLNAFIGAGIGAVTIWKLTRGNSTSRWFLHPASTDYYTVRRDFEIGVLTALGCNLGYLLLIGGALTIYQARECNTVEGWIPMNWQRANQEFTPGIPAAATVATYTKEDLLRCVKESKVSVKGVMIGYGYLLGHNSIITCSHFVKLGSSVSVEYQGRVISFLVTEFNFRTCPSNPELCVLKNGELFGNGSLINKIWPVIDQQVQQFDEVEIWSDKLMYKPTKNQMKVNGAFKVLTTDAATVVGDCGAAYVARFGSSWRVVALHYALVENTSVFGVTTHTMGAVATSLELKRMLESMGTTLQGIVTITSTLSKKPAEIQCKPLGAKSEVWAAISHHGAQPYLLGELEPPLSGMTLKSKIVKSIMYDDASEKFEEAWCGNKGYWTIPDFRGKMIDEKWSSLWTNSFVSENHVQPNEQLLIAALGDYLFGMQDLATEGFAKLSEEQALTGIPGSYINRVNIKTSVGPPYNRGKKSYVHLEPGQSHMAPEIWEMFDAIEQVLKDGHIPSFAGLGTAKDEPIKPGKFPRVFVNLPFAVNMHLKMRGTWKSFFRTNMSFFECAVGINMTSIECNKIVHMLESVDKTLTNLCDGDAKALDKSWSGQLWDYVALTIYAMSFAIGVDPNETYQLALGLKHTTYSFKNDLFRAWWNPSGNDWTVELNSILISLCERVVYYLHNPGLDYTKLNAWFRTFKENPIPPDCGFSFRKNIALVTYGDDNVKACGIPLPPTYCQDWLDQVGIIMTDAQKTGQMRLVPLSEISFLKRDLVWDEDMKCYLPPLSKKSIARMLLMKRDSTLTSVDHAAVVCSEALREAVYHGRVFYEELSEFVKEQSEKFGFDQNPLFVRKDFEFWREKIKDGSFQTWSNREPVAPVSVWEKDFAVSENIGPLETNFVLQGRMSEIPIANAGNDPAKNEEKIGGNSIQHDTGLMNFMAPALNSVAQVRQKFFQTAPVNPLTDFMKRATEIYTLSLSDADSQGIVDFFDPWQLYLANAAVGDKTANYKLIRGTLQLIFVCAIPGNAFGSYVITGLPNGGTAVDPVASSFYYQNCMQTDHFVRIDCASSEDAVIQLEWIWPYDYAELPTGPLDSWQIYLTCLSPLQTALPGGLVSGTIRVFANLLDDYELVVPHYQGKQGLVVNDAMKTHAPKTHKRLTQASSALSTVQDLAKQAEGLPIVGEAAKMVGLAAGAAKGVMSWFGFTRALDYLAPTRIVNRSVSVLSNIDGTDLSEVAALMQTNRISVDPLLVSNTEDDVMSFTSLFSRWTLVKTISWDGSQTVGTVLGSVPVTPLYAMGNTLGIHFTPAGYVGSMFTYWRGDMEYLVIIPVSKLHRGNVQALWIPVGSTVSGTVTNTTLNTVYDVATAGEKQFTIGYARAEPFLQTRPLTDVVPIYPTTVTNGSLIFRVVTPLVSPNPDALSVDILVFARAKPNMEFSVPNKFMTYVNTGGTAAIKFGIQTNVILQGATGDEDVEKPEPIVLVAESGPLPCDELFFGERIESVRALFQKPSRLITRTPLFEGAAYATLKFTFHQLGHIPDRDPFFNFQNWTWQGYLRPLFVGIAASERYKVLAPNLWVTATTTCPDQGAPTVLGEDIPNTLSPWSNSSGSRGYEIQLPFYTPRKYVLGRETVVSSTTGRFNEIVLQKEVSTAVPYAFYYSYADDIRVTGFRQVPLVIFNRTSETYPVLF